MGLLQIVHLETNEADADLVGAELKNSALECQLARILTLTEISAAGRGSAAVPLLSGPE